MGRCGPCKQFTPRLVQFYKEMKAAGKPFEVMSLFFSVPLRTYMGTSLIRNHPTLGPYRRPLRRAIGPCKQFTPRLVQFYKEMKAAGKPFEVISPSSFCHCSLKALLLFAIAL